MSYYNNERSKVNLMSALVNTGWKVYGFKADESDAMTDYYSPAYWNGIATKNGFVLVVDQSNTRYSGYEVKEFTGAYGRNNASIYNRIEKLQNMTVERGASEQEEETAKASIEKLQAKLQEPKERQYNVVETYPTFKQGNPANYKWHIEDAKGTIMAMGSSVYGFGFYSFHADREENKDRVDKLNTLIEKMNKAVSNPTTCMIKKVSYKTKEVVKPVEEDRTNILKGDFLTLPNRRGFWKVVDVWTDSKGNACYTYELVGKKYQALKNTSRFYQTEKQIMKQVEEGRTKIHTMQTVTEKEEITKWVKEKYISIPEVKEEMLLPTTQAPEATPAAEEVQPVVEVQEVAQQPVEAKKNVSVEVNYNQEKNGIELKFTDKPSDEVRANLKSNGFRWSKFNSVWYAKDTQDTRDFVNSYFNTDNQNETPEEPQTAVYPEIEVNDIETYTVSQELSDRENAGHWVFRSDKRDHQAEIQNTLQSMNNDVLGLLEGVTDVKVIYNAKRWLQSYKKRYFEWYVKKLRQDANNPSWTTTGRDGRNRGKDAKYQSAYDKLMRYYIDELKPEYDNKLWSIKKQVNKIKQQAEAVELQKAIDEAQPIELTRTKGLVNYHARANENVFVGGTVSATIYNYQEYSIVKTWGSWRIYKNGIELSSDRYATLDTAKKVLSVEVAKAA